MTVTGNSWIDVRLSYGYFDGVGETEMAQQLVRAVKLLVVERSRVFYEGRSREVGYRVEPGRDTLHRDARTYRERLAEISAEGTAADGRMRLFCAGLTNISGTIAPGTLAIMTEESFLAACREVGLAFLNDLHREIAQLKYDVYIRPMMERAGVSL